MTKTAMHPAAWPFKKILPFIRLISISAFEINYLFRIKQPNNVITIKLLLWIPVNNKVPKTFRDFIIMDIIIYLQPTFDELMPSPVPPP
jgi:hypothetical protein